MGGSAPSVPDPTVAATAGIQQQVADYPYQYIVDALAQTGGIGAVTSPTGTTSNLDFTGLGTADVQNQYQNQMAQSLLQMQQTYGPQYVAQALNDLQQSDPQGYAAYQQLWQQIQNQNQAAPPNLPLATGTQTDVLNNLTGSQALTPEELTQVQQGVRGGQVASGVFLGNAPAQAEAGAVVGATDQKNATGQQAAGQYLAAGVTPADIQYQTLQQDMANMGAFVNGQTPTAQFSQIGGAQGGAAPYPNTGYQSPTLNEGQAASQGINNALGIYQGQVDWSNSQVNPYMAGLNFASQGLQTASNLGAFQSPYYPSVGAQTFLSPGIQGTLGGGYSPTVQDYGFTLPNVADVGAYDPSVSGNILAHEHDTRKTALC